MLPLFILVPLAGLLLVSLVVKRFEQLAWSVAFGLCLVQIAAVVLAPVWLAAESPLSGFVGFHLSMTDLSRVVLLAVGIVLACTLLVAQGMLQKERLQTFSSLILVSLIGMNGMALVSDLFSLYVFLEITSVGSFVLIAFNRDTPALEGAFKYIVLSAVATVLMLGSVALLMLMVGGTSFGDVHDALARESQNGPNWMARLAVGGFVCGLLIKGGLVPFHGWVLGAYSAAPAPVSVLLGGIATKVSGIYGLIRLSSDVFPQSPHLDQVFLAVGMISIVVGAFAAIGQTDLKRMLSYSSISQVGYIILGLGAGPIGVAGAVFHLFNHAIFKSLLFVTSSALEKQTGTTDMSKLGGLDSRMKVTSSAGLLAMLSTAGVPPLSGFWSKLVIVVALWQTNHHAYAMLAVAMSVVTLAYMLVMQKRIFFGKVCENLAGIREAGPMFTIPALGLAGVTVVVGVLCPFVMQSFLLPIKSIF